jgi:predicted HTH domain antitoxin
MKTIELPDELLTLLKQTRLGTRPEAEQVRLALAIHLFQEGLVSIGKAAELASEPRIAFELLLRDLGIPVVRYDEAEYERDLRGMAAAAPQPTAR